MKKNYVPLILLFLLKFPCDALYSQEFKLLQTSDFDLHGAVKSCITITDYGTEEFYFKENGALIRSVTRFNETDYDQTVYEYHHNNLVKKYVESYREGNLDKAVSFIHVYKTTISELKKITEHIYNYQEQFVDQFEYFFDEDDLLVKVIRQNDYGIEEREITHAFSDGILVEEVHVIDDLIQKVIKRITPKITHEEGDYERMEIFYDQGKPDRAILKFVKKNGQILFMDKMKAGKKNPDKFYARERTLYTYNEAGFLEEQKTFIKGKQVSQKKFDYEYETEEDGYGNWLRRYDENAKSSENRTIKYYY